MPPFFGVSAAPAAVVAASAAAMTTAETRHPNAILASDTSCCRPSKAGSGGKASCLKGGIRPRAGRCSLIEPDGRQILVQVMAWTDLPAFDVGAVWHDAIPPQKKDRVRLVVQHVLLEAAHQRALLRRVGLGQHLLIEFDLARIFVEAEILRLDRVGQVALH